MTSLEQSADALYREEVARARRTMRKTINCLIVTFDFERIRRIVPFYFTKPWPAAAPVPR